MGWIYSTGLKLSLSSLTHTHSSQHAAPPLCFSRVYMRTYVILKSPEGAAGSLATTRGRLAAQAPSDDSVLGGV